MFRRKLALRWNDERLLAIALALVGLTEGPVGTEIPSIHRTA